MIILRTLLVIVVCFAEKPKVEQSDETKNLRTESEKFSSKLSKQQSIHSAKTKNSFLSNISILEAVVANSTEVVTTAASDDNVTTSEETLYNYSIEYDNTTEPFETTEISLFSKPAVTITTESPIKKNATNTDSQKYCGCDLTYQACDINCCCDKECTGEETKLFSQCLQTQDLNDDRYCHSHLFYYKNNSEAKIHFDSNNLFCIMKDNLPDKRAVDEIRESLTLKEVNILMESFDKWPRKSFAEKTQKVKIKPYVYGDPVLLIENSDASILDIPYPFISDYCSYRRPVKFLKNTASKCIVKFSELEMFNIYEYLNKSVLASVPKKTPDKLEQPEVKNCSNVDCVNWTISTCDYQFCETLNLSKHAPFCDEFKCLNIATKLKFVLHCSGERIKRAEIYLYVTNVTVHMIYIEQEIDITYYMEKDNTKAIELSGNSGYIVGKPVIKIHPVGDGSDFNSNNTFALRNVLAYPKNIAGRCVLSNTTHENIKFGVNFKSKCMIIYKWPSQEKNATEACNLMQVQLYDFLGFKFSERTFISPLGNPNIVSKDAWLEMTMEKPADTTRGEFRQDALVCYNFVSVIAYEFIHANFSRPQDKTLAELDRKILRSSVILKSGEEVRFEAEAAELVVGTHVQFFDVTEPLVYEFARGPHLYIHLPSDFFYPFTSNANAKCIRLYVLLINLCSLFKNL